MRKHIRCIVCLLLILQSGAFLAAEGEAVVLERYPRSLGAYFNSSATGGLSFQRWHGPLGYQIAAGVVYLNDAGYYDYNLQLGLHYLLFREDFADWFSGGLYLAGLVAHQGYKGEDGGYYPKGFLGFGIGMENVLLQHLSNNIEFMYVGEAPLGIQFAFGSSLRYRY